VNIIISMGAGLIILAIVAIWLEAGQWEK